jgi:hypothetical protein
MSTLSEVYKHPAVREFGEALGNALGDEDTQDYASLIDLEFAQGSVDFADALHRFLRRFLVFVGKKGWYCPPDQRVQELAKLVDECAQEMSFKDPRRRVQEAVRLVKAAILSRALTRACYLKRQQFQQQSRATSSTGGES